jgi:hypothetical protein
MCATPLPLPPHGPGVVIDGSPTVLINMLPACRLGDTVLEAVGPPNKITSGEFTVIIGQQGKGSTFPARSGGVVSAQSSSAGAGVSEQTAVLAGVMAAMAQAAAAGSPLVCCEPG